MIELPPIEMQITHFELHQGYCLGCGRLLKAEVPSACGTGYGPRLSALIGALSGMHGTSRRLVQDFCHSVLHIPISLGAVQKVIVFEIWTSTCKCAMVIPSSEGRSYGSDGCNGSVLSK
jgi:transposase